MKKSTNLFRRAAAFALTAAMTMGMCLTGFAESTSPTGTPAKVTANSKATINIGVAGSSDDSANGGDTLNAYKVVDIQYDVASNNLTYEFTELFTQFQKVAALDASWKNITAKDYCDLNEDELKSVLGAFTAYIKSQDQLPKPEYTAIAENDGTATITDVAMGQYIIIGTGSSNGAKIYQTVTAEVEPEINASNEYVLYPSYTVAMKTDTPSIGKEITGGTHVDSSDTGIGDQGDGDKHTAHKHTAAIGDVVNYKLNVKVPTYPEGATNRTFYVGDTLSKGLTFESNVKIVVKGYETDGDKPEETLSESAYKTTVSGLAGALGGNTIYVDFDFATIKKYNHVTIEYTATVNKDAQIGTIPGEGQTPGNSNKVELIYSNAPFNGTTWNPDDGNRPGAGNGYGKDEDMEIVVTYALVIDKYEEKHEDEKLSGAEFDLYTDETCTEDHKVNKAGPLVTDANGVAYYEGLAAGIYYLKETKAPTGYNPMDKPQKITIDASQVPYTTNKKVSVTSYTYTSDVNEALSDHKDQAKLNGELVWIQDGEGDNLEIKTASDKPDGFVEAYVASEETINKEVTEISKGETANGYYKAGVANSTGAHLPSTGGMGTTLFTVIGLVLMIGAAIVLITRRRMSRNN